jgi:homopolymeric O-antigen transport system permease protein
VVVETETRRPEPTGAPAHARHRDGWIENRPPSRWGAFDLAELRAYRELGWSLALRDLKVRYKQTFFGVAWVVLQPLLAVLIFSIFFGHLAGLPHEGLPYPVFSYAGMTIWLYFSSAMGAAAQSLVGNRDLVAKVYFPRVLAPIAAVIPGLVDMGISLLVLAVFMAAYGIAPGLALILLPAWILFAVVVSLAVGLWLAALNVEYRDVKYVLGFLTQVWLFASPVAYASSLVKGDWRYLYALNPLVGLLDGFRWSTAGAPAPGPQVFISIGVGVLLLLTGAMYFRRVEGYFSDLI